MQQEEYAELLKTANADHEAAKIKDTELKDSIEKLERDLEVTSETKTDKEKDQEKLEDEKKEA